MLSREELKFAAHLHTKGSSGKCLECEAVWPCYTRKFLTHIEALEKLLARLDKWEHLPSMGIGDGSGQQFVYGEIEVLHALRDKLARAERKEIEE